MATYTYITQLMSLSVILCINGGFGEKHQYDQRNCGQIYTGEPCRNRVCDPTGMDILATSEKGHRIFIRGSGETSPLNLFASPFLQKDDPPPPHNRNLKYDAGQESWPGSPKFELATREHRVN